MTRIPTNSIINLVSIPILKSINCRFSHKSENSFSGLGNSNRTVENLKTNKTASDSSHLAGDAGFESEGAGGVIAPLCAHNARVYAHLAAPLL